MIDKRKATVGSGNGARLNTPARSRKSDHPVVRIQIEGARVELVSTGVIIPQPPKPKKEVSKARAMPGKVG